jgi:hypothetical protein
MPNRLARLTRRFVILAAAVGFTVALWVNQVRAVSPDAGGEVPHIATSKLCDVFCAEDYGPLVDEFCQILGCSAEDLVVEVYVPDKVYPGTTLLGEAHDPDNPRIIEVSMTGEILWEYKIPDEYAGFAAGGIEAQSLDNGNILALFPTEGIFEITRGGDIVWSYLQAKVSHDADRLSNGNVIHVFGHDDQIADAQVTEIDEDGNIVWQWYAKDYYLDRFGEVYNQGWTHTNAVQRLENSNTLISLRNFYLTTIVDQGGSIVSEYDWSVFGQDTDPHDPVLLPNGNLLVCLQNDSPYQAVEVNLETGQTVWTYTHNSPLRTARDCDRLPNGNTLIVAVKDTSNDESAVDESTLIEVTQEGEVVWQLTLAGVSADLAPGYFYKAERIGSATD